MKVFVWGTGVYASEILCTRLKAEQITAFIDNNINKQIFMGKPVIRPEIYVNINTT